MPDEIVKQRVLIKAFEADVSLIRTETYEGKNYTVIPLVALIEGVIQAANADAPELVLAKEFGEPPQQWDGQPVTVGHPMVDGMFVPATSPEIMEEFTIGIIFNSKLENKTLKMEAWIDDAKVEELGGKAENIVAAIKKGEEIDVSTGYFVDTIPVSGVFNGEHFEAIQENLKPNHLAILDIGQRGACSWEDGCGMARVNQQQDNSEQMKGVQQMTVFKAMKKFFGKLLNFEHATEESDEARRFALTAALTEKGEMFFSVLAVFQDHFVYERGWNELLRRSFSISEDGSITLGDELEAVRPVTNFIPVTVNISVDNSEEKLNMDKKEKIDALIANEATQFVEEDRETLDGMDEAVLDKLTPVIAEPKKEEEEEKAAAEEKEKEAAASEEDGKPPILNQEPPKPQTLDEHLNAMPQEIRSVMTEGLNMRAARKDSLVTALMANSQAFTEAELRVMEVDQLEKLTTLARVPDYSGLGGNHTAIKTNEIPAPLDVWNLSKRPDSEKAN